MTLVRKQVYISQQQNLSLQRKARRLGISEAELMRQALQYTLDSPETQTASLETMFKDIQNNPTAVPSDYVFQRNDAYAQETRFERWGR